MQLKVNKKYKKIGSGAGFTTQPEQIVTIINVTKNRVNYTLSINDWNQRLGLSPTRFIQEFIPNKNPISFKGLL